MTNDEVAKDQARAFGLSAIGDELSAAAELNKPRRPHILQGGKPDEAALVADYRERLTANLIEQADILNEMKAAGNYGFQNSWAIDHRGRYSIAALIITKTFP